MTPLESVRAKVIEAVPEIVELKYRCRISEANRIGTRQQKTVLAEYQLMEGGSGKPLDRWILTYSSSGFEKRKTDEVDFEILGRPITLADVIVPLKKRGYGSTEEWFAVLGELIDLWNLALSLDEQEPEVIEFLANVLGV